MENAAIAVELERLRGSMEAGLARIGGRLDLLVQRSEHTEQQLGDVSAHLAGHDARLDALERGDTERQKRVEARLAALEDRRWPLASLGGVVGVLGVVAAVWQALVK